MGVICPIRKYAVIIDYDIWRISVRTAIYAMQCAVVCDSHRAFSAIATNGDVISQSAVIDNVRYVAMRATSTSIDISGYYAAIVISNNYAIIYKCPYATVYDYLILIIWVAICNCGVITCYVTSIATANSANLI